MLQQPESGAVQPNVSPSSQQQAESGGVQIQPNVSPSLQQPAESGGVQVQPNVSPSSQQQAQSGGVQIQPNVSPSLQQPTKSGGVQVQPNVSPSSQRQAESGGALVQPNVSTSSQQQTESGGEIQLNVSPSLQQPAESGGVQVQPNANLSLKKPSESIDYFLRPPKSINVLPAGNLGENAHQPPLSEAEIAAVRFWEGRNHSHYRQLKLAAIKGDWKSAQSIIKSDPKALTARITPDSQTALQIAALFCRWEFILKLLKDLQPEPIEARDTTGNTVLHYVAEGGSLKTAKALIQKNARLLQMDNRKGHLPLVNSVWSGSKELVWYLTSITEPIESALLPQIISLLIQFGFHDIALYFVTKYPDSTLAKDQSDSNSLLHRLAFDSQHFFSGSNLGFLERLIYKFVCVEIKNSPTHSVMINLEDILESTEDSTQVLGLFKRLFWKAITQLAPTIKIVRDTKLKNKCAVELADHVCKKLSSMSYLEIFNFIQYPHSVMGGAVEGGNEEVVRTLLQYFPDLIVIEAMPQRNILQVAIKYRQEKIVNLMKEIYSEAVITNLCAFKMASGNTTLHLAGKLAPDFKLFKVSGAALQMQREWQWFKEVEKIIKFPYLRDWKNEKEETAYDVFMKEHEELAKKGEKWMKDTANSCMLVSTLIATVLFAAAFTVPGGNNDNGIPIFLRTDTFAVFAISTALGLFSSLTSLLMFLSILTARYAQEDFLKSLPTKLIIGLGSLFIAIAAMIIAFGATLTIVLSKNWHWVSVPITLLATFPVAIFVMLQLPLFIQMVRSTYGSGMFHP